MVPYPLLDMRGGASLGKTVKILEGFGVVPVIGVSGAASTGRMWVESQKIPLSAMLPAQAGADAQEREREREMIQREVRVYRARAGCQASKSPRKKGAFVAQGCRTR